jgi:glycolate oxidase
MGDGNLHPTFLTDERNAGEMHRVELAMQEIFDFALALGGTITGEHGVGLEKSGSSRSNSASPPSPSTASSSKRSTRTASSTPGKIFDL